jgi:hypothetical protein
MTMTWSSFEHFNPCIQFNALALGVTLESRDFHNAVTNTKHVRVALGGTLFFVGDSSSSARYEFCRESMSRLMYMYVSSCLN